LTLSYDRYYSKSVEFMHRDLPRQEWPELLAAIRRELEAEIQAARQGVFNPIGGGRGCFHLIRLGTTFIYLDTSPPDGLAYKTFLHLNWFSPEAAPIMTLNPSFNNKLRRLKEASIIVISSLSITDGIIRVDGCDLRESPPAVFWPVDSLSSETALRLFTESVNPIELQPFASLLENKKIERLQQLGGFYMNLPINASRDQLREIEGFLRKYGFSILGSFDAYEVFPNEFKIRKGYGDPSAALVTPESLDKYRLGKVFGNYRLFESLTYEIIAIRQNEGDAEVEIKISYEGCTPICEFIKDYWRLSVAEAWGMEEQRITRIVLPVRPDLSYVSRSYYGASWPAAVTFKVSYSYDPRLSTSWKLVGFVGASYE